MSWIPGWNSIAAAGWWSGFFFWASIVSLIGLGVAEVASHRYGERKEELAAVEQDAIQRRHDEDMARVQHDAAQANERAAELTKEAARLSAEAEAAKSEIARANAETAQARLEQERLRAQMAWRAIAPDAASKLKAALAAKSGQVNIQYPEGDGEAKNLAIQFANIFNNAGWQVGILSANMHTAVAWGLFVPDSPSEATTALRAALTAAGFGFSTEALPPAGMGFGNTIPNAPTLFVGTKPPPQ